MIKNIARASKSYSTCHGRPAARKRCHHLDMGILPNATWSDREHHRRNSWGYERNLLSAGHRVWSRCVPKLVPPLLNRGTSHIPRVNHLWVIGCSPDSRRTTGVIGRGSGAYYNVWLPAMADNAGHRPLACRKGTKRSTDR